MKISKWLWVFLLGAVFGSAGETMLFLRTQCTRMDALLSDDFRILAFLRSDPGESRARVIEERIRALAGVRDVAYYPPEEALKSLQTWDPELARSVALMGENPLQPAFEIQVQPDVIGRLEAWKGAVSGLPDIEELRYKPLQAGAILQARFYGRFLDLVMSLSALTWLLGAALGLWGLAGARSAAWIDAASKTRWERSALREILAQSLSALAGTLSGMGFVYLAALPLRAVAPLWVWPPWGAQTLLALSGAVGAGLLPEWRGSSPRRAERRPHPASVEADPMQDLVA